MENSWSARQLLKIAEKTNEIMKEPKDKRIRIIKPLSYYKFSLKNFLSSSRFQTFLGVFSILFIVFVMIIFSCVFAK